MSMLYTPFAKAIKSKIKKIFALLITVFFTTVIFAQPTITSFTPSTGTVGTLVTITGTNLSSPSAFTIGGVTAIAVSNDGISLVGMVMPGATTGTVVVTTAGGTATSAGNFTVTATPYPASQQGSKLVGTGNTGAAYQGYSVSVSADGNTAMVGGYGDNSQQGAAWVYIRSGSVWTQQGSKLVGTGNTGAAEQGFSVSLSADGNTAIVGGDADNSNQGAAWVYTRSGSVWTQQGSKLVGTGNTGAAYQGRSVSLSADGNTAIVGGLYDNSGQGAAWVYTRSGGVWAQQGSKLVGTGNTGAARQGYSVSLSADGNTAMVGGPYDNSQQGATWVYTRSGGMWAQQGGKLVGTGNTGAAAQGISVSVSADGNTAMVGGFYDNSEQGAAWVFTRSGGVWTQQGSKLVGTGNTGAARQGQSVSLSADGNIAIVGGYNDNGGQGAAWVYTRSGSTWTQQGSKLTGTGNTGTAYQGISVSVSADGNTVIVGGYGDNSNQGASWVYIPVPTITSFTPSTGPVGTLVTITGTNLSSPSAFTIGGVTAIAVSNDGTSLVGMVMPGATTGTVVVTTAGGTATSAGNFTVTATPYPADQQGSKLVGTGNTGAAYQGRSVSLSADGNTAIVGGYYDNSYQGAVWVYTRSGGVWTQQGSKLVGTGNTGAANQGYSVSLSADGNTAIVGGDADNSNQGAAWVYTRSGSVWTQQGSKLVGTGNTGAAYQGRSVSLSADGNTAIVGGLYDNSEQGAAWVYTRSGSVWTQQGSKLVGTGNTGAAFQGISVSLSADGNTAIAGGDIDNSNQGAAWVYTRSGGVWTQQGSKLVGTGNTGAAAQGFSVSLSADGNTAIVGGFYDNSNQGAAWVYTRSGSVWTQQGNKLEGTGNTGAFQGRSVSLSADGNIAIVGGYNDNGGQGAAWVYTRSGSTWTQQGSKLVGTGNTGAAAQGISVSLSADGNTAIVGGYYDNVNQGAAWVFISPNNWTGAANTTNWATSNNWSYLTTPIATDNVIIPNVTYLPVIGGSTTGSAKNLTINSSASLTVSGTLQIGGTISNSGTFDATAGTITMNGLSAQIIPASIFNSGNTIQNLVVNNSAGVSLGGILNISGIITPTAGVLSSAGYLTLLPTASVAAGSGSISGNVTVQQNLTNQRGWRILGSPFTTAVTLADLATASNIDITYGGTNAYGGASAASAETYNPSSDSWATLSSGNSWAANSPMALYIRGTKGQGIPGSGAGWISGLDYGGGTPTAVTLTATGTLNTSTLSYGITANKFNFVPNPFAATISVQGVLGSSTNFYYYNPASGAPDVKTKGGSYVPVTAGADAFIPKYGCFVYSPASGTTLSIPTSAISIGSSAASVLGVNNNQLIELVVESNAVYYDKMFVQLDPNSSSNSGDTKDLAKFYNDNMNVYSISNDGKRMAIDARNVLNTIPLGISALAGNYNFKLANNSLPEGTTVTLTDKLLNTQTALKVGDTYNFSITTDTASHGEQRFSLSFSSKTTALAIDPTGSLTANVLGNITSSNLIAVQIAGATAPVTIAIKDMSGRAIGNVNAVNGIQYVNVGNTASGMLILLISDGKNSVTKKVIKL